MKVVHCKKNKFDVLVDRTTEWGNPFTVYREGRSNALNFFENMIRSSPSKIARIKAGLAGKVLGCWCAPQGGIDVDGKRICHAQILARAARGDYDGE